MTSDTATLQRIETAHPLRGLGGLLTVELRAWFPWRALLLTIASFGVFALVYVPWRASGVNQLGALLYPFVGLWIAILLLSVVSLTEGSVLGEIERGTASWLVGMPIGRPAVVVAKFLAAATGITATVFGAGVPVYPILAAASRVGVTEFTVSELREVIGAPIGKWGVYTTLPDWGTYLAMLATVSMLLVFVVAVMILFGTTIRSRTAVFALGLAVVGLFGAAAFAGSIYSASPTGLIVGIANVAQGNEASFAVPVAATFLWTGMVLLLAVWRFNRRELT
ncbi:MAG: hypothetical protein GXP34_09915 [Actinobacteria bacterium]|nr:hypothetical protein [Actinomycetota bacterium]